MLSGSEDALIEKRADIAIVSRIPSGFLGDALMDIEFIAVAHPCHPLHALGRELEVGRPEPQTCTSSCATPAL